MRPSAVGAAERTRIVTNHEIMSDLSDSAAIGDAEFDPFAGPAISSVVPSTEAQREIWSAAQIDHAASLAYNEAVRIRLDGHLDIAALQAAMSDLAVRHEALRATFSADGLSMLIGEPVGIPVPVLDLTHGAPAERAALREAALRSTVTDVFDLEGGPLVRAKLLQVSAQTHELLLSAHHIVCDGWSFGVIAADLGALYSARRNRTAASLAVAPAFTDYAREITGDALGHNRTDDETFWLARFADGAPVLDLPTDRPRPALKTFEAAREDRVLPAELIRGLRAVGVGAGSSLFATLLAGFSTLLHRLSGQDDIVVGVPSAGQAESGRPGLVGHCVNMLPIRLRPTGSREFAAYLGDVRTDTLDAFDHQRLGFGRVVEKLRIARDPSRTPLVSVLFNVDRSLPSSSMPFDGIEAELVSIPRAFENFDLFLNAIETDAGMVLECQYNSDLFDRSTIQRWLESFELLLSGIAAAPATSLAALPIVTAADRAALESCNDTHLDVPPTALVHQLVEEQVTRSPGTIAIECQGERVTYHELNQRANRLAHHLQSLGVGRGSLIGL